MNRRGFIRTLGTATAAVIGTVAGLGRASATKPEPEEMVDIDIDVEPEVHEALREKFADGEEHILNHDGADHGFGLVSVKREGEVFIMDRVDVP